MKPKYITPYADEWFSGPPPEIGWWPASTCRDPRAIRYYDGEQWSKTARAGMAVKQAARMAKQKLYGASVEWAKRWWEKA